MSTGKFVVAVSDTAEVDHRSAKRVIVHVDALKVLKLCSGDVVALSQPNQNGTKKVRKGQ